VGGVVTPFFSPTNFSYPHDVDFEMFSKVLASPCDFLNLASAPYSSAANDMFFFLTAERVVEVSGVAGACCGRFLFGFGLFVLCLLLPCDFVSFALPLPLQPCFFGYFPFLAF